MNINFVNNGSDEALLKSLQEDERIDQEELVKAIDKSKLVQVEVQVQGKNGMFTRKQWKNAGDVKSTDKVIGRQQPQTDSQNLSDNDIKLQDTNSAPPKQKSTYFKADQAAKNTVNNIAAKMGNDKLLSWCHSVGVTWTENDHKGINTMRAKMALAQAIQEGKVSVGPNTSGKSDVYRKSQNTSTEFITTYSPNGKPTQVKGLEAVRQLAIGANKTLNKSDRATIMSVKEQASTYKFTVTNLHKEEIDNYVKQLELRGFDIKTISEFDNSKHDDKNFGRITISLSKIPKSSKNMDSKSNDKNDDPDIDLSDYSKLTSENQSGTNEGEAHNLIVGYLKSNSLKLTDENVKKAARKFATEHDKLAAKTKNKDEQKHAEDMTKVFDKLAGNETVISNKFSPKSLNFKGSDDAGVSGMLNKLNSFVSLSGLQNGQPGFGTIMAGSDKIGFGYDKSGPYLTWNGKNYTDPKELGKKFQ